jgi:hypothetical protein
MENNESSEFDQFDEIPFFITSMIKPRIPLANEAPYMRNNHHEKVNNFKKIKTIMKSSKIIV